MCVKILLSDPRRRSRDSTLTLRVNFHCIPSGPLYPDWEVRMLPQYVEIGGRLFGVASVTPSRTGGYPCRVDLSQQVILVSDSVPPADHADLLKNAVSVASSSPPRRPMFRPVPLVGSVR